MIPAEQPYTARFQRPGPKGPYILKPVIAWDDEGHALVADEATGRLRVAASWPTFVDLLGPRGAEDRLKAGYEALDWCGECSDDKARFVETVQDGREVMVYCPRCHPRKVRRQEQAPVPEAN